MMLGIGCGLFFGEYCDILSPFGDAYVGLLQMTVLPYIVFALISSIGRLSLTEGKKLATVSISVLAALWGIAILTVAAMFILSRAIVDCGERISPDSTCTPPRKRPSKSLRKNAQTASNEPKCTATSKARP